MLEPRGVCSVALIMVFTLVFVGISAAILFVYEAE